MLVDQNGQTIGFLMPKVTGRLDIHNAFATTSRRAHFPDHDYGFLVAVAANLARAIANVHDAGHVVGDINERFAMLAPDATVTLIDCDSFQIAAEGRVFTCDVATPIYQPPELQTVRSFRGLRRTRNHDCFGLAVLIFQLLFLGRHPFAGRPRRGDVPPIEEAIRRHLFAYDPMIQSELDRPPHSLPLESLTPKLQTFFRAAFGPDGPSRGRPKAEAWARELDAFRTQLKPCAANPLHRHLGTACPLCAVEASSGVLFFLPPAPAVLADWLERAQALWRRIEAIATPAPLGEPPKPEDFAVPPPAPVPHWRRIGRRAVGLAVAGLAAVLLAEAGPESRVALLLLVPLALYLLFSTPEHPLAAQRRLDLDEAKRAYEEAVRQYRAADAAVAFRAERDRLAGIRQEVVERLPRKREQRLEALRASAQAAALRAFLENFELRPGDVPGFGAGRIATLNSFGIETAADLEPSRLEAVPGIGRKRQADLLAWRREKEKLFRPAAGQLRPDRRALAQLEAEIRKEAAALLAELEAGCRRLQAIVAAAADEHRRLRAAVEAAARRLAEAQAALAAVTD